MRIQERLDDAVQALHRGSQGRLSVPVPHGVRIVAFRTVPEEDVSRIIADLENTADLLDEAERVVEGLFAVAAFDKFERADDEPPPLPEHSFDVAMQNARAFLAKLRGECNILEETTQACPRHGYSHTPEQPNGND